MTTTQSTKIQQIYSPETILERTQELLSMGVREEDIQSWFKTTEEAYSAVVDLSGFTLTDSPGKKPTTRKEKAKELAYTKNKSVIEGSKRIVRLKELQQILGLSRSTIYNYINEKSHRFDPTFPRRLKLGPRMVGWLESEIHDWISKQYFFKN